MDAFTRYLAIRFAGRTVAACAANVASDAALVSAYMERSGNDDGVTVAAFLSSHRAALVKRIAEARAALDELEGSLSGEVIPLPLATPQDAA